MERASGILYPIFSLPSKYGIGCFSKEAYEFVDFLKNAGQSYWQILPVGPTGYGDSPYQPFSAFAGNPYFISPEGLVEDGLLTQEYLDSLDFGQDQERVDYGALYQNRFPMLEKAFEAFQEKKAEEKEYQAFCEKEAFWLMDYALFTAIKKENGGASWLEWEAPLRKREAAALKEAKARLKKEIDLVCFEQYEFDKQWRKFLAYAAEQGIQMIGDIPFYVALDSADAWSHPEAFKMDKEDRPTEVAGCPPDAFSADGQIWGTPLYRWEKHRETNFGWWMARLWMNFQQCDLLRIDHFRGLDEYFSELEGVV